jgi:Lrp/AsnC family leucine-responsive transcriptional regulator
VILAKLSLSDTFAKIITEMGAPNGQRTGDGTAPAPSRIGDNRPVDDVDRALLDALRTNARATYAELARVAGLSAAAVHDRVAKLEATGVITGYHAAVAPAALGLSMGALIGVFVTDQADTAAVEAAIAALPEVEDCWFVAGEESYVVKVRVPDVEGLEQLIGTVNRINGVARTRTTVVLSTKFESRAQPARPVP